MIRIEMDDNGSAGQPVNIDGDGFQVDEHGALRVFNGSARVAVFAPGAWRSVRDQDATAS